MQLPTGLAASISVPELLLFTLAFTSLISLVKKGSDAVHDLALRSKGHGGLAPRTALAIFPMPRSTPFKRLKRQPSALDNIGEMLPFWRTLTFDIKSHPWRIVAMEAAERTFCFALSAQIAFSSLGPDLDSAVSQLLLLSLGVRILVPLASTSRLLIEEVFNLSQLSKDDTIRASVGVLGGLLEGLAWFIGIAIIGTSMGFDMTSAISALGIGSLALAFSLQKTLEALASTVAILIDRPFVVGERIILANGDKGVVERIGVRTSQIRSLGEGDLLIVPNVDLASQMIKNRSRCEHRRIEVRIEVDSAISPTQLALVKPVLQRAVMQAPNTLRIDGIGILGIGPLGGIQFEVIWLTTGGETQVMRDSRHGFFLNAICGLVEIGVALQKPGAAVGQPSTIGVSL